MAKVKEMLLPKDPRYLKYPLEGPFDQEKAYWTAFNCSRCSVCKWVDSWRVKSAKYARICPQHTRYLFDSHSGQGKCDLARAIIEGKMKWEDDPEIKDILFQCTMCGGCDAMDKGIRDGELVKLYRWMRSEYIKKFGPLPEHKAMIDSIKQYDNVWLQPRVQEKFLGQGFEDHGHQGPEQGKGGGAVLCRLHLRSLPGTEAHDPEHREDFKAEQG